MRLISSRECTGVEQRVVFKDSTLAIVECDQIRKIDEEISKDERRILCGMWGVWMGCAKRKEFPHENLDLDDDRDEDIGSSSKFRI